MNLVALTDGILSIEALALAVLLFRATSASAMRTAFVFLFASTGFSALFGAISHGLLADADLANSIVWRCTLLSIGVAATSCWFAAAYLLANRRAFVVLRAIAILTFALYLVAIFAITAFVVAAIEYAPAALALLVAFLISYVRSHRPTQQLGAAGVVLIFLASGVQQSSLRIGDFDHNTLYHLITMAALALIFIAARDASSRAGSRWIKG